MNDQEDCEKERLTLTRKNLAGAIYRECPQLSRRAARRICDEVLDEIIAGLVEGDAVRLQFFGSFKVREKRARVGRNPINGVECEVSARRSVFFKPSPLMIASLNGSKGSGGQSK